MNQNKLDLCELSRNVRGQLKTFITTPDLDKSLKPAIQSIITACLQLEFIVFVQAQDSDLEDGLRDDDVLKTA